jgi:branched-chain amino acid transport system ATP-binding protein
MSNLKTRKAMRFKGRLLMRAIGILRVGNPELLLLDEPSEGVAPLVVRQIERKFHELKRAGLSIVLAEQNLDFVLALSDRCYVLEKGAVAYSGTAQELGRNLDIQDRYLHV